MTIDTDFHNHVVRSSPLRMAEAAHARGLRVLGLSEHVFQMREARPLLEHMPLEGPMLSFVEYIQAVQALAQQTNCEVRLGLEVDFIPEKSEQIQAALRPYPWDYLIGSVHEIDGEQFENDTPASQAAGEALWLRYFQLLREAIRSGYFDVVSHPVRMRAQNPCLPPTLDDELALLAQEAAQADVALEINGSDMRFYPEVVQRLAQACARHRTPISIGSDAHHPGRIAQSHVQSEALLRKVGITRVRIWKQRVAEEYTFS